jgi:hypothetical protein
MKLVLERKREKKGGEERSCVERKNLSMRGKKKKTRTLR